MRPFQIDKDQPIAYLQITTDTAAAATTTKVTKYDPSIRVMVSSKSKNFKPTSGHLKVRNLNQPMDTKKNKVKATTTHKKCPEVVLDFFATRVDEAKQDK